MATINRAATVFVLALLVVLAGCSGGFSGGGDANGDGSSMDQTGAKSGRGGGDGDRAAENAIETARTAPNAQGRRALIRTGHARLEVASYDDARSNLTQAVTKRGGYVSDSVERVHRVENTTWTSGRIVFRVPAENFSAFFERVKEEGEVLQSSTNTTDVTDRIVDLEARLKNLRAQRDRLRKLYNRANDTESVLAVGKRLSEVQGTIERLRAKHRVLRNRIAYSTVIVELNETVPETDTEATRQWYETGIVDAFLESVDGAVVTLRALLVIGAYITPYFLLFGLPLIGLGVVFHRRVM